MSSPLRLAALLPGLALCGLIFYLSSIPGSNLDLPFQVKDKILHLGAFGVLTAAWIWGLRLAFRWSWPRAILVGMAIGTIYGASDEIHQLFVAGRSSEFLDWVADTVGAAGAGLFFLFISKLGKS